MMGSSILPVVSVSVGRRIATGLGICFAVVCCMWKWGKREGKEEIGCVWM
jgi:hypothetical protein